MKWRLIFENLFMKNILIYTNTHMQIINAIQIKRNLYPNDKVDLIISDHTGSASSVAQRISCNNLLFHKVRYVKTHFVEFHQGVLKDIADIFLVSTFSSKKYQRMLDTCDMDYHEIYYFNESIVLYPIIDAVYRRNRELRLVRFEEGLASYQSLLMRDTAPRLKIINVLRNKIGRKSLYDLQTAFCCYFPMMLREQALTYDNLRERFFIDKGQMEEKELLEIPILNRDDKVLIDSLNVAFAYNPQKANFKQKYIYFASCSDIDGYNVGETELVLKIAELVGPENLLVKMHPRDGRSVYSDAGLTVSRESNVPWEIVQLNYDFSGYVFISLVSSSILNATAMLGDSVKTWYLWKCAEKSNSWLERNINGVLYTLKGLWRNGVCENINVAEKLMDIMA